MRMNKEKHTSSRDFPHLFMVGMSLNLLRQLLNNAGVVISAMRSVYPKRNEHSPIRHQEISRLLNPTVGSLFFSLLGQNQHRAFNAIIIRAHMHSADLPGRADEHRYSIP